MMQYGPITGGVGALLFFAVSSMYGGDRLTVQSGPSADQKARYAALGLVGTAPKYFGTCRAYTKPGGNRTFGIDSMDACACVGRKLDAKLGENWLFFARIEMEEALKNQPTVGRKPYKLHSQSEMRGLSAKSSRKQQMKRHNRVRKTINSAFRVCRRKFKRKEVTS